ncbi:MAG: response regulator [Verrucomicrobia bacterium]|nr:response regulator [Verrucomicrobiota bacterium]
MMDLETIRVLLVEDDEDDCFLAQELLKEIKGRRYLMDWANTYESGLQFMARNKHDVCLVDYRLGAHDGVELISAAKAAGALAPAILMTGAGQEAVDLAAMKAGASDYLIKGRVDSRQLERSIRYAIERQRAASLAAFEQARLAAFGAQVGLELACRASLDAILENCARAMAQYLNADLAQIWIYDAQQQTFVPRAHAGPVADATKSHAKLPTQMPGFEGLVQGKPVFIPSLAKCQGFADQAWADQEELLAFAAYPLVLEDRLVGCMSLFTRNTLAETVLQEINSVAHGVALCIQRKQAEAALDASENRYRTVVESIKEVVFQMDPQGRWLFLNPAWTTITGFPVEDSLGRSFLDFLPPEDRESSQILLRQLLNREIGHGRHETRLITRDGKVGWAELYLQLTPDRTGGVAGVSGSLNDITERKLAEAEVQKLAAFPRANPNPVLEFAADGQLNYANEAAFALAKSLGKTRVLELLPAQLDRLVSECLATGTTRLHEEVSCESRTLTWSFFPVAASRVVHCYGADITEMLNLEAQFRHAQKLESIGQLAAGIAHDFNNILTVIQGYADCLLMRPEVSESSVGPLKRIAEASRRAAALTRQLLMFSRKQAIVARALNLNDVLRNFANMLPRLLGEDIVMETHYATALPQVEADSGMLEQIVMNLAVNARDAMPKGGRLIITTEAVDIGAAYVRQRAESRPGRFVCMSVADTGCGIDSKTLTRIFEPFFSTKEIGHGTGLGLSTVYGIVRQHQGWVDVSSEVGVGTTFKIFLPSVVAAVDQPAEADDAPLARGGRETVLHVEDEPILRDLVREVLSQYEYRILEAGSGNEAIKVWEANEGRVDLLLTDMVMPEGMNGRDLAEQLRSRKPDLKVIYTSGYSANVFTKDQDNHDGLWLEKPYQPSKLARTIRECLDHPTQSETESDDVPAVCSEDCEAQAQEIVPA